MTNYLPANQTGHARDVGNSSKSSKAAHLAQEVVEGVCAEVGGGLIQGASSILARLLHAAGCILGTSCCIPSQRLGCSLGIAGCRLGRSGRISSSILGLQAT